MTPLFVLLTTAAQPIVAELLHAELASGAPLNTAVKTVLASLEAKIANPAVRTVATNVLSALVSVVEGFATPATAPKQ